MYFLTALVGAGGNAGNQAAVRCIRGLALRTLNVHTMRSFLKQEIWMALILSLMLGFVCFLRALASSSSAVEVSAIVFSCFTIVGVSVLAGAVLPLGLLKLGADPAHASTTIQVIMDISGVAITMVVTAALVDNDLLRGVLDALLLTQSGMSHSSEG